MASDKDSTPDFNNLATIWTLSSGRVVEPVEVARYLLITMLCRPITEITPEVWLNVKRMAEAASLLTLGEDEEAAMPWPWSEGTVEAAEGVPAEETSGLRHGEPLEWVKVDGEPQPERGEDGNLGDPITLVVWSDKDGKDIEIEWHAASKPPEEVQLSTVDGGLSTVGQEPSTTVYDQISSDKPSDYGELDGEDLLVVGRNILVVGRDRDGENIYLVEDQTPQEPEAPAVEPIEPDPLPEVSASSEQTDAPTHAEQAHPSAGATDPVPDLHVDPEERPDFFRPIVPSETWAGDLAPQEPDWPALIARCDAGEYPIEVAQHAGVGPRALVAKIAERNRLRLEADKKPEPERAPEPEVTDPTDKAFWTTQRDLDFITAIQSGGGMFSAAKKLGVTQAQAAARFKHLMPIKGASQQLDLIKKLKKKLEAEK